MRDHYIIVSLVTTELSLIVNYTLILDSDQLKVLKQYKNDF